MVGFGQIWSDSVGFGWSWSNSVGFGRSWSELVGVAPGRGPVGVLICHNYVSERRWGSYYINMKNPSSHLHNNILYFIITQVAFENMVQCPDGHLFCTECLQRYSKEATYGQGKTKLFCMTDGCDTTFPLSQLRKALSEEQMQVRVKQFY